MRTAAALRLQAALKLRSQLVPSLSSCVAPSSQQQLTEGALESRNSAFARASGSPAPTELQSVKSVSAETQPEPIFEEVAADAASTGTAHGPATVQKQLKRKRTPSDEDETGAAAHEEEVNPDAVDLPGADVDATTDPSCGLVSGGVQKRKRSQKVGRKVRKKKRGFVDVPRTDCRGLDGRTAFVDGNQRSCSQDALVNGAKALGVPVTKKRVHADTLPPEGDTEVGVIVDYARDTLGITMLSTGDVSTLGYSIYRAEGGPAHALLQLTEGVYFVEICVSQCGKPDDYHAVIYNASYTVPSERDPEHYGALLDAGYTPERFGLICGAIVDNDKGTPVKFIEPSDREMAYDAAHGKEVPAARRVFDSLFPFASTVRVVGAWLMRKA